MPFPSVLRGPAGEEALPLGCLSTDPGDPLVPPGLHRPIGISHQSDRQHDRSPTNRACLMYSRHYHTPVSTRARCPVCHEAVYSRAGIHPQCAMSQADPPRPKRNAQKAPADATQVAVAELAVTDAVGEPPTAATSSAPDRISMPSRPAPSCDP